MLIRNEDLDAAIQNGTALFNPGDEISEDIFKRIFSTSPEVRPTNSELKILSSNLFKQKGDKEPRRIHVTIPCTSCSQPMKLDISRQMIIQHRIDNDYFSRDVKCCYAMRDEANRRTSGIICKECFEKEIAKLTQEADEITAPLEWILANFKSDDWRKDLFHYGTTFRYENNQRVNEQIISVDSSYYNVSWENEEWERECEERRKEQAERRAKRREEAQKRKEEAHRASMELLYQEGLPYNQLPSAPTSEKYIIQALVAGDNRISRVCELLTAEMFNDPGCRQIFEIIEHLFRNKFIDRSNTELHLPLILDEIAKQYPDFDLEDAKNRISNADKRQVPALEYHAYMVAQKYIARSLYCMSDNIRRYVIEGNSDVQALLDYATTEIKNINYSSRNLSSFQQMFPDATTVHTMTFGKYKGRPVMEIIDVDPSYIRWALDNTGHAFTQEEIEELKKIENQRNQRHEVRHK